MPVSWIKEWERQLRAAIRAGKKNVPRNWRIMVNRNDERFFDFMCHCSDEGEERCERTYDEVMAALNEGMRTTDKTFLDHVVFELDNLEHGAAYISGIYADQWAGIYAKHMRHEDDEVTEKFETDEEFEEYDKERSQYFWVECDRVHHGLARIYQLVKEYDESLGKNVMPGKEDDDAGNTLGE